MKRPAVTAISGLLPLLAACEPRTGTQDSVIAAADTIMPGDTTHGPAAAGAGTAGLVHVPLNEWRVGLRQDTLPAGRVTFHVMNQGQYHHALEIERGDDEWKTDHIAAGGEATLQVDLRPGTYAVYCPIEDTHGKHDRLGMRTTLVVR